MCNTLTEEGSMSSNDSTSMVVNLDNPSYPPVRQLSSKTTSDIDNPNITYIDEQRPLKSYIELIATVIFKTENNMMRVAEIYENIMELFPYFQKDQSDWRIKIRQTLTTYECFIKSKFKYSGFYHKSSYWSVNPSFVEKFKNGKFSSPVKKRGKSRPKKSTKNIAKPVVMVSVATQTTTEPPIIPSPIIPPPVESLKQLKNQLLKPAEPVYKRIFDIDSLLAPSPPKCQIRVIPTTTMVGKGDVLKKWEPTGKLQKFNVQQKSVSLQRYNGQAWWYNGDRWNNGIQQKQQVKQRQTMAKRPLDEQREIGVHNLQPIKGKKQQPPIPVDPNEIIIIDD